MCTLSTVSFRSRKSVKEIRTMLPRLLRNTLYCIHVCTASNYLVILAKEYKSQNASDLFIIIYFSSPILKVAESNIRDIQNKVTFNQIYSPAS